MKALVVTRSSVSWSATWSEFASTATQALDLWREKRYDYVFADIGELGGGMTGPRLATTLRKEAGGEATVIILMADTVQAIHIAWAKRCGANDVIHRTLAAITTVLPSPGCTNAAAVSALPASVGAGVAKKLAGMSALVESRLHTLARMGPARSVVVADAIDQYIKDHGGATPTLVELAGLVSNDIHSAYDRAYFLKSFTGVA